MASGGKGSKGSGGKELIYYRYNYLIWYIVMHTYWEKNVHNNTESLITSEQWSRGTSSQNKTLGTRTTGEEMEREGGGIEKERKGKLHCFFNIGKNLSLFE